MDAAVRLGRRPGPILDGLRVRRAPRRVGDADWNGKRTSVDGVNISFDSMRETRNLGVFLLREPSDTAVTRVEVYNLDRAREYSGYRVYWLGRAGNEESLNLLRGLVEGRQAASRRPRDDGHRPARRRARGRNAQELHPAIFG